MTCYFHNYNLKQSWLDLFSFLTLLRAFNKITSVNSTGLGRSKNLLLSSLNHLHQSKINFVSFYSDPEEKLDLALKAVMVKYKDIFCPFLCTRYCFVTFFLTTGRSQSHYFITLPFPPVWNFLVIPGGRTNNILELRYWIQHKIMGIVSHIQADSRRL